MLNAKDVAIFFIQLDDGTLFNKKVIQRNGSSFYEGNARLNKFLHLAQNIYFAKTGNLLMDTEFYAYSNGAVIPYIQQHYTSILLESPTYFIETLTEDVKDYLTRFFLAFKNADIDELIEIDHEDSAWQEKKAYVGRQQIMDTASKLEEYKEQYKDIITILDRMKY